MNEEVKDIINDLKEVNNRSECIILSIVKDKRKTNKRRESWFENIYTNNMSVEDTMLMVGKTLRSLADNEGYDESEMESLLAYFMFAFLGEGAFDDQIKLR